MERSARRWPARCSWTRPTRIKPDYSGLATNGVSGAEEIQSKAQGARVVKAFNTAFAARQADPNVAGGLRVDGYAAGDDEEAKQAVLALLGDIGFNPVDAGPLAMARHLEGMAWLNISLQMKNGWSWQAELEARRAGRRRRLTTEPRHERRAQEGGEAGRASPPSSRQAAGRSSRAARLNVTRGRATTANPAAAASSSVPAQSAGPT